MALKMQHLSMAVLILTYSAMNVRAHISLRVPAPFGSPDTSPLESSGSNYPCKSFDASSGPLTTLDVSQIHKLSFSGTAVHLGGSCQLSLGEGHSPSADTKFKVILSIHGGCPGPDVGPMTYDYLIPQEVPNGNYTLAWTWFNRVGNREMYMNCARVSVAGASSASTSSSFESLPDIAVYNIKSKNRCTTIEGSDVDFPDPGKYVKVGTGFKPLSPKGCGADIPIRLTNVHSESSSPGSTSTMIGGGTSVHSSTPCPQNTTVGSEHDNSTSRHSTNAIVADGEGRQPCSLHGALVCSGDGTQFGLCNRGEALMMQVAAGTKCAGGQISGSDENM